MANLDTHTQRPMPRLESIEAFHPYTRIIPAPEVLEWANAQIISEDGELHNPDHFHLQDADLCFLWASSAFAKQGRIVLGQAEQVAMRAGGWQKARMEQQMHEWFGQIPTFIITLAADYCAQCSDLEFCALVEHELYHISQQVDEFGAPKFTKEGLPKLCLRGHDVSEFVAIVDRYGVGAPDGDVARMVEAAKTPPKIGAMSIAHACGTCMLRIA